MFEPRGYSRAELGDLEVIEHEGALHLFHLTLPNHDLVGHAVSSDGLSWRRLPPALVTGPPGSADDDMIWTMSVTKAGDTFQMLYTALSCAERGRVQRVARATSSDLLTWKKEGIVAEADPRYYETAGWRWVSFRDPKPVRVDDRWHVVVCAREREGPPVRRGAVGLLTSDDLVRFTVEPPLFAPRQFHELECPQLFPIGDRWALMASVLDDRSVRVFLADGPEGPFVEPPGGRLLPAGCYAARLCRFQEQLALLCTYTEGTDRHGEPVHVALSPLVLEANGDRLACRSWPGWSAYAGATARVEPGALRPLGGGGAPGRDRLEAEGMEAWAWDPPERGLRIEAQVRGESAAFGVALGLDADGSGFFVEVDPHAGAVRLVKAALTGEASDAWAHRTVIQDAPVEVDAAAGCHVAVRTVEGEMEVSVDRRVALTSWVDQDEKAGRAAVWVASGTMRVDRLEQSPIRSPATGAITD